MLHLIEINSAEIYARKTAVIDIPPAREGSLETMGFKRRFLWYFLFADEKKVRTFPKNNPSVSLREPAPSPLSVTACAVPPLPAGESLALYTREP